MPSLPVWHALGTSVSAATAPTNLARAPSPRTRVEHGPCAGTAVQWTPPFSRCSVGWGNTSSAICASTGSHYLWQLALLFGREKASSLHFHCTMFGNCPLGLIRQRQVCECPRGREGYRKSLMVMYHCTCQLVCHKRLKLPAGQLSD